MEAPHNSKTEFWMMLLLPICPATLPPQPPPPCWNDPSAPINFVQLLLLRMINDIGGYMLVMINNQNDDDDDDDDDDNDDELLANYTHFQYLLVLVISYSKLCIIRYVQPCYLLSAPGSLIPRSTCSKKEATRWVLALQLQRYQTRREGTLTPPTTLGTLGKAHIFLHKCPGFTGCCFLFGWSLVVWTC